MPPSKGPPSNGTWTIDDPGLYEALERTVGRLCRSPPLAEHRTDVLHDAWVRLKRRSADTAGVRKLNATYLWTTATNAARRKWNELAKRRQSEGPIDALEPSAEDVQPPRLDDALKEVLECRSPGVNPEKAAIDHETYQAFQECLAGLTPSLRRAVFLRIQDWKVREIAEYFRWKPHTADNRVYRGLDKLRTCLKEKGFNR